jgi:hypothetical protein
MSGFQCPYCSHAMSISKDTYSERYNSFESDRGMHSTGLNFEYDDSCIELKYYKCPHCENVTVFAVGLGVNVKMINMPIKPTSSAKQFPDYVPIAIRQDYEEACAVSIFSPKASATLARRCLQGMIRNFWEIDNPILYNAINELQGKIPATQWRVIDGVRRIGNIGAHMEKDIDLIVDIDSHEAEKLIKLIEHLLEQWYINRHDQEELYGDIIGIDESKQSQRHNSN